MTTETTMLSADDVQNALNARHLNRLAKAEQTTVLSMIKELMHYERSDYPEDYDTDVARQMADYERGAEILKSYKIVESDTRFPVGADFLGGREQQFATQYPLVSEIVEEFAGYTGTNEQRQYAALIKR